MGVAHFPDPLALVAPPVVQIGNGRPDGMVAFAGRQGAAGAVTAVTAVAPAGAFTLAAPSAFTHTIDDRDLGDGRRRRCLGTMVAVGVIVMCGLIVIVMRFGMIFGSS